MNIFITLTKLRTKKHCKRTELRTKSRTKKVDNVQNCVQNTVHLDFLVTSWEIMEVRIGGRMKNLDELLSSLCEEITDKKLKSKQAAFNSFLEEINKAKELYSLENISKFINEKTELNLSIDTYRTMIDRAKRKQSVSNVEVKTSQKRKINNEKEKDNNSIINVRQKQSSVSNYTDYMNVCFNKERIVQQAIENNVSVETIRSWGCANFVQVSNTLGNYIRNKR